MDKSSAKALLRDAVALKVRLAKGHGRADEQRDELERVLADLRDAGQPANVDDYDHPSDV